MTPDNQSELLGPARSSTPAAATNEALLAQLHRLQSLFVIVVFTLIVLALTFGAFITRQNIMLREQLQGRRKVLYEFQTVHDPVMREFMLRLQQFAVTNQSFQPILARYTKPAVPPPSSLVPMLK